MYPIILLQATGAVFAACAIVLVAFGTVRLSLAIAARQRRRDLQELNAFLMVYGSRAERGL